MSRKCTLVILLICLLMVTACENQPIENSDDDMKDSQSQQNVISIDLPKLEKPYPFEKAIENGDVVNLHGNYSNMDVWNDFLESFEYKQATSVRITQYTIEGDPIFYELNYNGLEIEYTYDNSMDAYGGNYTGTTTCKGLQKKLMEDGNEEIYILTDCESEELGDTFHFR